MVDTKLVLGRHLHVLLEEDGEGRHHHLSWIQRLKVRGYGVYFLLLALDLSLV